MKKHLIQFFIAFTIQAAAYILVRIFGDNTGIMFSFIAGTIYGIYLAVKNKYGVS